MVSVGFRGSSTSLICGIYISKAIALNLQGRVSALKKFKKKKKKFFFFHHMACGIEHVPPALKAQSLNHWTAWRPEGTFLFCFRIVIPQVCLLV